MNSCEMTTILIVQLLFAIWKFLHPSMNAEDGKVASERLRGGGKGESGSRKDIRQGSPEFSSPFLSSFPPRRAI